jgi:flagellar operon protein
VKADNKGVRDALVMIDGFAVVANAKSMTVITAVGEDDLKRNIFTNIDGAVFA